MEREVKKEIAIQPLQIENVKPKTVVKQEDVFDTIKIFHRKYPNNPQLTGIIDLADSNRFICPKCKFTIIVTKNNDGTYWGEGFIGNDNFKMFHSKFNLVDNKIFIKTAGSCCEFASAI